MLLPTPLATLLVLALRALGGQVPVLDGVPGGTAVHNRAMIGKAIPQISQITASPGKLRVVENSGVCETTPGVYQASGYGDIAYKKSIWFWFFEARVNPDQAPLTVWLNGGPGSSSMIGLFQEHGPCRIVSDSSGVVSNPYSWNNVSNMLYIDQPVGVGFSHGELDVRTSEQAAADMWTFLQIFFTDSKFSKYQQSDFALWTESYGGHYGPTFAAYFLQQNTKISSGTLNAMRINMKFLGVGDGLTDPLSQYPGYMRYAVSNPYHPLVSDVELSAATTFWNQPYGCKDNITACYRNGSDAICADAQTWCNNKILGPLSGNYDVYYVLSENSDPYTPDPTNYLNDATFMKQIGAESPWQETNLDVYANFLGTGDWMRNSRPLLETVIDADVRTVIYDGDADYILNYMGVEAMVNNLQTKFTKEYAEQEFTNWTVHGESAGIYKNAGTFSYVRIFGAGHEVAAYGYRSLSRGEAALQMFSQIMNDRLLYST
ncbi:uncharacterized protein FIBRA_03265 [Fibroporia radiculosa]|uniref:Carboxypeptidase n=1 Tax=Fibroporia radiculosa TaxID=599839 RepID=J4HVW4_9APHY|nr:uncharacterized protein FIBRA_03265 [Fibroporia radiculosa]CCM01217.1 predicted protein [Fibroporia radiculosa]